MYAQENARISQEIWKKASRWNLSSDGWTRIRQQSLLAQLQTQAHQADLELKEARLAMLVSLNKETNAPLTLSGKLEPVSVQGDLPHFQLWATEFRPELKTAIYALELDSIAIDLTLAKRYPDILLNASYERVGSSDLDDENKQISLAVRLPIPYTFSQQVNQKKAEQKKGTLHRAAIEDTIRVQVTSSFEKMEFWQQEALSRRDAYQSLTKLLQQQPTTSSGTTPLEAFQGYLQTARLYLEALRENHTSKAELEWAIGKDL